MIDPCAPVRHTAWVLRAWRVWRLAHPAWHALATVGGCGAAIVALPFVAPIIAPRHPPIAPHARAMGATERPGGGLSLSPSTLTTALGASGWVPASYGDEQSGGAPASYAAGGSPAVSYGYEQRGLIGEVAETAGGRPVDALGGGYYGQTPIPSHASPIVGLNIPIQARGADVVMVRPVEPVDVPEPSSVVLVMVGIGLLAWMKRICTV